MQTRAGSEVDGSLQPTRLVVLEGICIVVDNRRGGILRFLPVLRGMKYHGGSIHQNADNGVDGGLRASACSIASVGPPEQAAPDDG